MPIKTNTRITEKLTLGSGFCECGGCGLHFLSAFAFDTHRIGSADDRGCDKAPHLQHAGFELDSLGYWRGPKHGLEVAAS